MNIKDLVEEIKRKDPKLYQAISGIIDQTDDNTNKLKNLLEDLKTPDVGYGHSHKPPGVRMRTVIDRVIGTSVTTIISWTAGEVQFDNHFFWEAAWPTRLTFRDSYRAAVGARALFETPGGAGRAEMHILLNGVTVIDLDREEMVGGFGGYGASLDCKTYYSFNRGDYIELALWQNTGGAVDAASLHDYSVTFWAVGHERLRNKGSKTENFLAGEI